MLDGCIRVIGLSLIADGDDETVTAGKKHQLVSQDRRIQLERGVIGELMDLVWTILLLLVQRKCASRMNIKVRHGRFDLNQLLTL